MQPSPQRKQANASIVVYKRAVSTGGSAHVDCSSAPELDQTCTVVLHDLTDPLHPHKEAYNSAASLQAAATAWSAAGRKHWINVQPSEASSLGLAQAMIILQRAHELPPFSVLDCLEGGHRVRLDKTDSCVYTTLVTFHPSTTQFTSAPSQRSPSGVLRAMQPHLSATRTFAQRLFSSCTRGVASAVPLPNSSKGGDLQSQESLLPPAAEGGPQPGSGSSVRLELKAMAAGVEAVKGGHMGDPAANGHAGPVSPKAAGRRSLGGWPHASHHLVTASMRAPASAGVELVVVRGGGSLVELQDQMMNAGVDLVEPGTGDQASPATAMRCSHVCARVHPLWQRTCFFLTRSACISVFGSAQHDIADLVQAWFEPDPESVQEFLMERRQGPDFVFYKLVESCVHVVKPLMSAYHREINGFETRTFMSSRRPALKKDVEQTLQLHLIARELSLMKSLLSPAERIFRQLLKMPARKQAAGSGALHQHVLHELEEDVMLPPACTAAGTATAAAAPAAAAAAPGGEAGRAALRTGPSQEGVAALAGGETGVVAPQAVQVLVHTGTPAASPATQQQPGGRSPSPFAGSPAAAPGATSVGARRQLAAHHTSSVISAVGSMAPSELDRATSQLPASKHGSTSQLLGTAEKEAEAIFSEDTIDFLEEVRDDATVLLAEIDMLCAAANDLTTLLFNLTAYRTTLSGLTMAGVSAVFLPLTWICGIYGTNFSIFPELQWGVDPDEADALQPSGWAAGYMYFWLLMGFTALASVIALRHTGFF